MGPTRLLRDARDLYRGIVDLLVIEESNEAASYEIAASARDFSRTAQAAVDDKLNFSATLMRAGEVEAANRLLKEFHDHVQQEEVALIEKVNEVKAAEAVRREGITRVRMARMLAVAVLGAGSLSMSAAGMALAGLVQERATELEQVRAAMRGTGGDEVQGLRIAAQARPGRALRRVKIGRVRLLLSASELRTIRELTDGTVDQANLQDIIGLLPDALAKKVQQAIVVAGETTDDATHKVAKAAALAEEKIQKLRVRRKARQEAKAADEEPKPEESEAPSPGPTEPTGEEDQPVPDESPSDDDDRQDGGDDGLPGIGDERLTF